MRTESDRRKITHVSKFKHHDRRRDSKVTLMLWLMAIIVIELSVIAWEIAQW